MTEYIEYYRFPLNNYQFEAARLKSFHTWPHPWKKSEEFAAAGFFYTGESDIVKCFECGGELWKWKVEDDPMVDHQRWLGKCRFIRKIPCGNVPISIDSSAIPASVPEGVDECGIYVRTNIPKSSSTHGDQENFRSKELASKPKHPEYVNYAARLASYDKWPKAMSQTKEELATAGFYYSGSGDETLCYYCDGGLMDWELYDDPWIEHAKWFNRCPYLLVTKGLEFVNNIRKPYTETETGASSVNELDKRVEKDDSESIASERTQNSLSEKTIAETSTISGKANPEEQSVQIQVDKPHNKDATLCKICFTRELRIAFIPCGHLLACAECASNMKICGICRKNIEIAVQVYFT